VSPTNGVGWVAVSFVTSKAAFSRQSGLFVLRFSFSSFGFVAQAATLAQCRRQHRPYGRTTAVQNGTHFRGACLSFQSARVGTGLLVCGGDFVAMSWLSTLAQASDSIFERVTCSLVFAG